MTRTTDAVAKDHLQKDLMKFRQGDISASELIDSLDNHVKELVAKILAKDREPTTAKKAGSISVLSLAKTETCPERQPDIPKDKISPYIRILGPEGAERVTVGKIYRVVEAWDRSSVAILNNSNEIWYLPPAGGFIEATWPYWEYAPEVKNPTHVRILGYSDETSYSLTCQLPPIGTVHEVEKWKDHRPIIKFNGLSLALSSAGCERAAGDRALMTWADATIPIPF